MRVDLPLVDGHAQSVEDDVGGPHLVREGHVFEPDRPLLHSFTRVDAIVDYYGPTNFMTILPQSTPHGLSVRVPALQLLLGDRPENMPELARLASPVFHVDEQDPPLLMIHGDQDPQVPINQSHELHGKYKQHDLDVTFEVIHGGAHGGPQFFDAQRMQLVEAFLRKHLATQPQTGQKALQSN